METEISVIGVNKRSRDRRLQLVRIARRLGAIIVSQEKRRSYPGEPLQQAIVAEFPDKEIAGVYMRWAANVLQGADSIETLSADHSLIPYSIYGGIDIRARS
jgi:hypothetical protein